MFKKPDTTTHTNVTFSRETTTTSPALSPSAYANTAESNYPIINEFLVMKGDLESEADILVKGQCTATQLQAADHRCGRAG